MPEGALLTYADLVERFPVDNIRRELIDGELFVSPSPLTRHQEILGRLYLIFANHLMAHGGGKVYVAPLDTLLSETNVVQPDLLFITDDQTDIITKKNVQGVPALIVEVLSDPRMDRVRKRKLYARFGVPEYWIVDPESDRVEVYRSDARPDILEPPDVLTYDRVPGLSIDLRALFAE